jgi:trk system potassium uptake protein TrkA
MVEITMPKDSPVVGRTIHSVAWPKDTVLTGIIRDGRPVAPEPDETIESGDELLFLADVDSEAELRAVLVCHQPPDLVG